MHALDAARPLVRRPTAIVPHHIGWELPEVLSLVWKVSQTRSWHLLRRGHGSLLGGILHGEILCRELIRAVWESIDTLSLILLKSQQASLSCHRRQSAAWPPCPKIPVQERRSILVQTRSPFHNETNSRKETVAIDLSFHSAPWSPPTNGFSDAATPPHDTLPRSTRWILRRCADRFPGAVRPLEQVLSLWRHGRLVDWSSGQ